MAKWGKYLTGTKRFWDGADLGKGRLSSARDRMAKVAAGLFRCNVTIWQGMTIVRQSQRRKTTNQGEKEQIAGQKASHGKAEDRAIIEYDNALRQYRAGYLWTKAWRVRANGIAGDGSAKKNITKLIGHNRARYRLR